MKSSRIIIVSAVISITSFFALSCSPGKADDVSTSSPIPAEPDPVSVEAYNADYGKLVSSVDASGLLRGVKEASVVAETSGKITALKAGIGDYLKAGAPIITIDDSIAVLNLRQAEQDLESIKIDYDAVERAYRNGNASNAEYIKAKSAYTGAEARLEQARKNYENTSITAPLEGYLADLNSSLEEGSYLSTGSPIGVVVDLSGVKVDVFVSDDDVGNISEGAPAVIMVDGLEIDSEVEAVALSSDRATGSFKVIVSADNPYGTRIRSGMPAVVSINPEVEDSLVIPSAAVVNFGGSSFVYVEQHGRARLTEVEPGKLAGDRIEIRSGLVQGETVLVTGIKSLADGYPVIFRLRN